MKIERIDHLNLTVAEIDRSVEFYQRVLGMKTESMGEGRAALYFGQQKIHPDAARGLDVTGGAMAMSGEKRMPAHICFITEALIGEVTAHLEGCGVPVRMQGPRAGAIGTIQSVYIDDPRTRTRSKFRAIEPGHPTHQSQRLNGTLTSVLRAAPPLAPVGVIEAPRVQLATGPLRTRQKATSWPTA